jgi:hypothetical protein
LRAGAVLRLRVAAAFRPAATRFGLFLDEVFRPAELLGELVEVRFRVLAAFRAAVLRLRVAAALRPAAARFGDFRAVVLRAVDFRAVDFRAVGFRAVDLRAAVVFRLRVAAAFRPAAARFGDFREVDFRAVVRLRPGDVARLAVVFAAVFLRVVAFRVAFRAAFRALRARVAATRSPSSDMPGAGVGIVVPPRSGAIIPPCSGALGRSTVSRSQPDPGGRDGSGVASSCSGASCSDVPIPSSESSVSFHGQVRSDIGMQPPPRVALGFPTPST